MTSRFILPFADIGSGILPSDGAKLYFYDTGTTTPKDTYSDSAGLVANANPVISDSDGVFSDIFLSGTYNVVLKDKNDVQIWEADPVSEIISGDGSIYATKAELIASGGSALITHTDADSVDQNLQTYLRNRHVINVKDEPYNATGDGTTDDTAALKAAFTEGANTSIPVYMPAGTYLFTQITLDSNDMTAGESLTIYGDGRATLWKRADGFVDSSFDYLFSFSCDGLAMGDVTIEKMAMDGNFAGQTPPSPVSQYEQSATIEVQAINGGTINNVVTRDLHMYDPVADDIKVGPSNTYAGINQWTADNITFGPRNAVRSSLIHGSGVANVNFNNVKGDNTGAYSSRIETEMVLLGDQKVVTNIQNADVGRLEFAGEADGVTGDQYVCNMTNVTSSVHSLLSRGRFNVRDSRLAIDITANNWVTSNGYMENTQLISKYDDGGTDEHAYLLFQRGAIDTKWKFVDCESIIDAPLKDITNAVDNGAGLVRLTATAHTFSTGDWATVKDVQGALGATGTFEITVVDANTIDLIGSTFSGTYSSGGTISAIGVPGKLIDLGTSNTNFSEVELVRHKFDERCALSVENDRGGLLRTTQCKFAGTTDEGVFVGDSATTFLFAQWISLDDDFTKVQATYPFDISSSASGTQGFFEIKGGRFNSTAIDIAGNPLLYMPITSDRVFKLAATPVGTPGIAGDTAYLDEAGYVAASGGAAIAWRCMETDIVSATWAVTLTK